MNVDKEVRRIEAIIDKDFESIEFWNIKKESALILSCQLFEEYVYQIDMEIEKTKDPEKKLKLRESIYDLMQALEWIIKITYKKNNTDGYTVESEGPLVKYTEEAFAKGLVHSKAEQIFLPYGQNHYTANVLCNKSGKESLEFKLASEEFGLYEGINSVLLEEHNNYKLNMYSKTDATISKLFGNIPEAVYQNRSMARVEFDFDFPDDYKVGPYTIQEIKAVWRRVIREAWWGERDNKIQKDKDKDRFPDIIALKPNKWSLDDVSKETVNSLLNDLTYTGKRKGKQKYTSPITEPIFELEGKKVISPRFILYHQPARNILSSLNRIYDDEANIDSHLKEEIFVNELEEITKSYSHLSTCNSISVEDTDIDFGIYDNKTETLVLIEMKWFVEPVTAVEIESKDKEIKKGLFEQLPKYKEKIDTHPEDFTLRAFGNSLNVNQAYYFVLTRNTIGSGLISNSPFTTINKRMLKRALFDSNGDLNIAANKLSELDYYPKNGEDFSIDKMNTKLGGVIVNVESIKKLPSSYNLSIPSDDTVHFLGIEMNPEGVPRSRYREIEPGQYELTPIRSKIKGKKKTSPKKKKKQERMAKKKARKKRK